MLHKASKTKYLVGRFCTQENLSSQSTTIQVIQVLLFVVFHQLAPLCQGFIKTTDQRPTDHRPTDPPTHRPLTTYPPTHRPTDRLLLTYVEIEDQILNMFCIL